MITFELAQKKLDEYLQEESKALVVQRYSIAGRSVVRPDLPAIQKGIEYWQQLVTRLGRRSIRIGRMIPL